MSAAQHAGEMFAAWVSGRTLAEIGDDYLITAERVRQIITAHAGKDEIARIRANRSNEIRARRAEIDERRRARREAKRRANQPHGTEARYASGCKCDICRAAHTELHRQQRVARAAALADDSSIAPHGRASTYNNWMCRCADCTAAHSAYLKGRAS